MAKRSTECNYEVIERSCQGMDAVFCWFVTKETKPYENYVGLSPKEQNRVVPRILTFNRWDGMVGTVGGKVDDGEKSLIALVREVKEEVGFDLPINKTLPLMAVRNIDTNFKIQSYICELEAHEMVNLIDNATKATHYEAESSGLTLDHLTEHAIDNLLLRPFVASGYIEYVEVLKRLGVK